MTVISKRDVINATGTNNFPGIAALLMRLMKIDAFNSMMQQAGDLEGVAFTKFVLDFLGITLEIDPADLLHIPPTGAFIAVANHPYGAVEFACLA